MELYNASRLRAGSVIRFVSPVMCPELWRCWEHNCQQNRRVLISVEDIERRALFLSVQNSTGELTCLEAEPHQSFLVLTAIINAMKKQKAELSWTEHSISTWEKPPRRFSMGGLLHLLLRKLVGTPLGKACENSGTTVGPAPMNIWYSTCIWCLGATLSTSERASFSVWFLGTVVVSWLKLRVRYCKRHF